jgi:hypothetical protein
MQEAFFISPPNFIWCPSPHVLGPSVKNKSLQACAKWYHTSDHHQYLTMMYTYQSTPKNENDYYSKCQQASIDVEAETPKNYISPLECF